jgi:uncharacterized protein YndB with AHSA1/START domain
LFGLWRLQAMNQTPVEAQAMMLIRKPVAEVFEAFIDPAITSKFWFTKSSGRVQPGAQIQWDWEMYGASAQVIVKAVEDNRRILIDWGDSNGFTTVEWLFSPRASNETYVTITNTGFSGSEEEIIHSALDSVGGFTTVLCGLKALLEHNINLNLIADKFPDAIVKP